MGLWSMKRAGEIGIGLAVLICLLGAAASTIEATEVKDPIGDFLSSYGMPSGVVGLLGWFLRHLVGTVDKLRLDVVGALQTIGKEHRDSIKELVERNAELEERIFASVLKERDQKAAETARALKLKT